MSKILKTVSRCRDCFHCAAVVSGDTSSRCSKAQKGLSLDDIQGIPDWCPLPSDQSSKLQELREAVRGLIELNSEARKKSGSWKPLQIDPLAEREVWNRIHRAMEVE